MGEIRSLKTEYFLPRGPRARLKSVQAGRGAETRGATQQTNVNDLGQGIPTDENKRENAGVMKRSADLGNGVSP